MRDGKTTGFDWRPYFSRQTAMGRLSWQLCINSMMTTGLTLMAGCAWSMLMVALVAGMLTLALHRGRAGIFELFGVGILLGYYWEGWAIYFGLFAYPFTTVLPPHTGPMWGVIAVMAVCIYEVFLPTPTRR